jgi:hypothetical protein
VVQPVEAAAEMLGSPCLRGSSAYSMTSCTECLASIQLTA